MPQNLNLSTTTVYPLVLLGGGHSHALVLTYWRNLNADKRNTIRPLLISDQPTSPYSGMLPGLLADEYSFDDCHINLVNLCTNSGCDFLQGHCINIQRVASNDYPTLYRLDLQPRKLNPDLDDKLDESDTSIVSIFCEKLSLNIGSQPTVNDSENSTTHNSPISPQWKVKPISHFFKNWQSLKSLLNQPANSALPGLTTTIQVVGAGAAGVEIACAIKQAQPECHVKLIARSRLPLPSFSLKTQQRCLLQLRKIGIEFINNQTSKAAVMSGTTHTSHTYTVWCTQSAAPKWLQKTEIALSDSGFICVDQYLQTSFAGVFAAGDCAHFNPQPLPKAGVYAVRQAKILFKNLLSPSSTKLTPFKPQLNVLAIINMGKGFALAEKGRWSMQGYLPWLYKRRIDQSFMRKFS